jgi:hypothetical protein
MKKSADLTGSFDFRVIAMLAGAATMLACGEVRAQTAGPTIYQGRALVTAASSGCRASVGDSFAATIRIPVAMPKHYRIALLGDREALHLARNTKTSVAVVEIDDDGSLMDETVKLAAGGTVTTLPNGTAEASATFTGTGGFLGPDACTVTLFFALSTPPA